MGEEEEEGGFYWEEKKTKLGRLMTRTTSGLHHALSVSLSSFKSLPPPPLSLLRKYFIRTDLSPLSVKAKPLLIFSTYREPDRDQLI